MRLSRRSLLQGATSLGAATQLGGCFFAQSYRYKLALEVDTPQGVKSGYNVVEVSFGLVILPAQGVMAHVTGEALFLDLGAGARPLIALLTKKYPSGLPRYPHWDETQPTQILARIYGVPRARNESEGDARRREISAHRGLHDITVDELPDLVTFTDVNEPRTVMAVDPRNLEATLGAGVRWRSRQLGIVDEPITRGIERRLPWIKTIGDLYLDGEQTSHANGNLANGYKSGISRGRACNRFTIYLPGSLQNHPALNSRHAAASRPRPVRSRARRDARACRA